MAIFGKSSCFCRGMEAVPCPWWARLERILARMDDVRHNNPITERLGGDIQACLTVSGIPRQPRPACQEAIWSVSLHLQPQPSPLRRLHLFGYSTHPQPSGFRRPPSSRVSRAVDGWSLLAVVTPSRRQRQRHGPGHGSPVRALRRRFVHATAGDNLVKWLVFPLQGDASWNTAKSGSDFFMGGVLAPLSQAGRGGLLCRLLRWTTLQPHRSRVSPPMRFADADCPRRKGTTTLATLPMGDTFMNLPWCMRSGTGAVANLL